MHVFSAIGVEYLIKHSTTLIENCYIALQFWQASSKKWISGKLQQSLHKKLEWWPYDKCFSCTRNWARGISSGSYKDQRSFISLDIHKSSQFWVHRNCCWTLFKSFIGETFAHYIKQNRIWSSRLKIYALFFLRLEQPLFLGAFKGVFVFRRLQTEYLQSDRKPE